MAVVPFPTRNKLAYPAGKRPGIDPSHPASGRAALSWIATNASYIDLQNPAGVVRGAVAATGSVDGLVGPSLYQPNAGAQTFSKTAKNDSASVTFAAILRIVDNANNGFKAIINFNSSFDGIYLQGPGSGPPLQLEFWNGAGFFATPAVLTVLGRAYFVAISSDSAGTRYIATDLATGQVTTGTNATTYAINGTDASLFVGNDNGGDPSNCNIAAAMFSKTSLNMLQLQQWANDPWAFWYPTQAISLVAAAAVTPPTTVLYSLMNVG